MNKKAIFLDNFSGSIIELPKSKRNIINALKVLALDSRISTFDFSEYIWLCNLIDKLKEKEYITEIDSAYPWHKYQLTDKGKHKLKCK